MWKRYSRFRSGAVFAGLAAAILAGCAGEAAPPTDEMIDEPTIQPTEMMTDEPTAPPTEAVTAEPTQAMTEEPTLEATEEAGFWQVHGDEPVIRHGDSDWDGQYTDPGAVIFHEGQFHMFRNGFTGWPPSGHGVVYMTSPDGVTWTQVTPDPILSAADTPYEDHAIFASSVVAADDGSWMLYFYALTSDEQAAPSYIGRASAPAPEGPWTVDAAPVLEPGEAGSIDAFDATAPEVIRTEDGYRMYYSALEQIQQPPVIGMATSADGVTWEKHPDPVLGPGEPGAWDANGAHQPRVAMTEDGYLMLYRSVAGPRQMAYGFATSEDGITWQRAEGNPVLQPGFTGGTRGLFWNDLLARDGAYLLFQEAATGSGAATNIWLLTH